MRSRVIVCIVLILLPTAGTARAESRGGNARLELLKVIAELTLPLRVAPGEGRAWHLEVAGEIAGSSGAVELAWDGHARYFLRVGGDKLPGASAMFGSTESWLSVPAHHKLFLAEHPASDATTFLDHQQAWLALQKQVPILTGVGALLLLPSDVEPTIGDDGSIELAIPEKFTLRIRRGTGSDGDDAFTLELSLGDSKDAATKIHVRKWSRVPATEFEKLGTRPGAAPKSESSSAGDAAPLETLTVETVDIAHLRGMLQTLGDLAAEKFLARINPKLVPDPMAGVPRIDGVPVVRLEGTPEEMGTSHGKQMREGVHYNLHRTLHGVGLVSTIGTGKWFPGELEKAWLATERYIPKRHVREIDALSDEVGLPRNWGRQVAVFPEVFHCSGIAVRGKATVGGKLYHGRVLDYMTHIGLQNAAVVTVHVPDGERHAWVNVGYAGLCGTVTAMNAKGLAMGEMGGRGEGYLDGMPMTFLMREVVERFDRTKDAITWLRSVPRTCEYYYVLSDASTRSMAGIESLARKLAEERNRADFRVIEPGVAYDLLPHPIDDAVLMSAGKRYSCLSGRVEAEYGKLDMEGVWKILGAGVGMTSNLHTALFAPESLEFWVAQAGPNGEPAYTQRISKLNLGDLLGRKSFVTSVKQRTVQE